MIWSNSTDFTILVWENRETPEDYVRIEIFATKFTFEITRIKEINWFAAEHAEKEKFGFIAFFIDRNVEELGVLGFGWF